MSAASDHDRAEESDYFGIGPFENVDDARTLEDRSESPAACTCGQGDDKPAICHDESCPRIDWLAGSLEGDSAAIGHVPRSESSPSAAIGFDFRAATLEDAKEKLRMIRDEPRFELLLPSEAHALLLALDEESKL